MERKIEAVIFDWAGTTIDYGSFAPVQAFIEAFKQYGISPTVDEVRKPMGMLKKNHIKTMFEMPRIMEEWKTVHKCNWTEADVEQVYHTSESSIMPILKDFASPKPFVLDVVKELKLGGIKIGSTTGYTDQMMSIVVPIAKELGYEPDYWCSPNSVGNMGRPYPFMLFKNMEMLKISSVHNVIKVGDTISDIQEGKNAGVITVGVIEGSSAMGLSETDYELLTFEEKTKELDRVTKVYQDAGADYVIKDMSELLSILSKI